MCSRFPPDRGNIISKLGYDGILRQFDHGRNPCTNPCASGSLNKCCGGCKDKLCIDCNPVHPIAIRFPKIICMNIQEQDLGLGTSTQQRDRLISTASLNKNTLVPGQHLISCNGQFALSVRTGGYIEITSVLQDCKINPIFESTPPGALPVTLR